MMVRERESIDTYVWEENANTNALIESTNNHITEEPLATVANLVPTLL